MSNIETLDPAHDRRRAEPARDPGDRLLGALVRTLPHDGTAVRTRRPAAPAIPLREGQRRRAARLATLRDPLDPDARRDPRRRGDRREPRRDRRRPAGRRSTDSRDPAPNVQGSSRDSQRHRAGRWSGRCSRSRARSPALPRWRSSRSGSCCWRLVGVNQWLYVVGACPASIVLRRTPPPAISDLPEPARGARRR